MKRIFTLLAAATLLFGAAKADTLTYGLGGDKIYGVGVGQAGANYSAAIEVPGNVAAAMKGSKVTEISVGFGSGNAKIIHIYITKDLNADPIIRQECKVSINKYNTFALDTPYEIDGEKFYIGYTYRQSTSAGAPLGFDHVYSKTGTGFDYVAVFNDGNTPEFKNYSADFGNLCLRATVEGDNLPQGMVLPFGMNLPLNTAFGAKFNYDVTVKNMGIGNVSSVDIVSTVGKGDATSQTFEIKPAIGPGETATFTLSASSTEENMALPVAYCVSKVNGKESLWSDAVNSWTITNSNLVSPRMVVIEENTGVSCGYCPRGYVGLETMREKYPNDVINLALHNYSYPSDPMNCATYTPWNNKYGWGAPKASVNRVSDVDPSPATLQAAYEQIHQMVPMSMQIYAWYKDDSKKTLETAVISTFAETQEKADFGYAMAYTRDGMGPYNQYNNYAGGALGEMGGFESLPKSTPLIYNDVARYIWNYDGLKGSLPAEIPACKAQSYAFDMNLREDDGVSVHKDLNIIALLVNRANGQVIQGAKCKIGEKVDVQALVDAINENYKDGPGVGAVDEIAADVPTVLPVAGGIAVIGEYDFAEIYNLAGVKVASLAGYGQANLPAGAYVVRVLANGEVVTAKVIVK